MPPAGNVTGQYAVVLLGQQTEAGQMWYNSGVREKRKGQIRETEGISCRGGTVPWVCLVFTSGVALI